MVNGMWSRNPGSVAIFEHLAVVSEDSELGNHGILLWSGVGHHNDMKEFILGYGGQDIYSSGHYQAGGRTLNNDKTNWMSYAESHDEQRLGYEVTDEAEESITVNTSEDNCQWHLIKKDGEEIFSDLGDLVKYLENERK